MRTIGGALDYAKLAKQHQPGDSILLATEIRRMADSGLKPRDIASAIGVHPLIVLRILEER